jgi:hypothetical protein
MERRVMFLKEKARLISQKTSTPVEPVYLSLQRAGYKKEAIRIQAKILSKEMRK